MVGDQGLSFGSLSFAQKKVNMYTLNYSIIPVIIKAEKKIMTDIRNKIEKIKYFLEKYKSVKKSCTICPHRCGADRSVKAGVCGEPYVARVVSVNLHHGEEPPISGTSGSGTIFFTGCSLKCSFCQNFPISQMHQSGRSTTAEELADAMIGLQNRHAHNINFVTPGHYIYQIVEALELAFKKGLDIPLVYNTGGFDRFEVIRDLGGIIDIYLPDMKYIDPAASYKYSGFSNYFAENSKALFEMFEQTGGELVTDENGIARTGLIIRHLVLPGNTENSESVLTWISEHLSRKVHLSLMSQYFPAYKINEEYLPELNRKVSRREYEQILETAEKLGFNNAWCQEL